MSAAQDNLARWREAEQGATEGPWWLWLTGPAFKGDGSEWIVDSGPTFICSTHNNDARSEQDATFIATSREAMPALLGFAEAVLALASGIYNPDNEDIRALAERHLGGGSRG